MAGSSDEREIRDAVAAWLRAEFRDGRVIHELNCGHGKNRIDVACVTMSKIISVEIKSKKDSLKRLPAQINAFRECSHTVIAVCDEKFFEEFDYHKGGTGFRKNKELRQAAGHTLTWCWPRPDGDGWERFGWILSDHHRDEKPDTRALLVLLWTAELRAAAMDHGLGDKGVKRMPGYKLAKLLWSELSGSQIEDAVCKALRQRKFAEADDAII